jgi:glucokinase
MAVIAIDVGGTSMKSAMVSDDGKMNDTIIEPTQKQNPDQVLQQIADHISRITSSASDSIQGVGLSIPGVVDPSNGTVAYPPNLPHWTEIAVTEILRDRHHIALPLAIENDAHAAAWGAQKFGTARHDDSFILISLGTGVGGAIVIDRQLYRGTHGMAGEIGHMIIQADGPISSAPTKGTLEAHLGHAFLSRYAYRRIQDHTDHDLRSICSNPDQSVDLKMLTQAADQGSALARQIWAQAGRWLGAGLINLVHLLDIRTFIITGGVAQAGDWLLDPAQAILQEQLLEPYRSQITLKRAPQPEQLGILGAAALIMNQLEAGQ